MVEKKAPIVDIQLYASGITILARKSTGTVSSGFRDGLTGNLPVTKNVEEREELL